MAVYVYAHDATDYSTTGLCGDLQPTSCVFEEEKNGLSQITMMLIYDKLGKWKNVKVGCYIKCRVPVRVVPKIENDAYAATVKTVKFKSGSHSVYTTRERKKKIIVYSDADESHIVKKPIVYAAKSMYHEETVTNIVTESWSGWVSANEYEEKEEIAIPAALNGVETVTGTTRLKDQLFIITSVEQTLNDITVTAQHVFYELTPNATTYKSANTVQGAAACRQVLDNLVSADDRYSIFSDCTDTIKGMDYEGKSPVEALLDPDEGICAKYGLSLLRDNYSIYALKNVGTNRGFVAEYSKNLLAVDYTEDIAETYTRIVPYGKDKKGNRVYITGGKNYIDSTHINDYAAPRVLYLDCTDTVDGSQKADAAQAELRRRANAEIANGVDVPKVSMTIDFLSLGDTEEYRQYRDLDKVYLLDKITIKDKVRGYNFAAQVVAVTHNVLTGMLESVTISSLDNGSSTRKVAAWQVPTIDGGNIRLKSITGGTLSDDAVAEDNLQDGCITTGKLAAGSVTAEKLAAGAITADTIEAGSITTDKLAAGAVTAEKIESKSITAEQLQAGLITAGSGLIADSAIDNAQIADGSITDAKIVDLTANKITGGTIDAGKVNVKNLNADNITVGTINGQRIPVLGGDKIEDGAISGVKIVDGAVTTDKIEDEAVTAAKIVAEAVTTDKLAANAVTANKILTGAVTAGKIAAGAVTADAIAAGAIQTTHISAAAQEALVLEAVSSVNVGGRNLLKNSDFAQGKNVAWGACPTVQKTGSDDLTRNFVDLTYNAWSLYQDVMLKANTRYTLSMDARLGSGAGESPVTVKLDTSNIQLTTQNVVSGYFKTGKRVYVSFTYGTTSQTERIYLRSATVAGRSIQVANIKLEEGNRPTDWSPAPEDPSSGVQTSSVVVSAEGVDIASTGHFRTNADTDIQMTSGDGQNSYIRFGGASADEATFIADKNGVQAPSGEFKTLKAAGNDVWSTGNLVVSTTKPAGHGILWIKPSATSTVNASKAASGETLDGGVERKIYLDRQGSDALTGTSFTYKVTAEFEEIKERRSGVKLQCILAGNSKTVTMTYTYTDSYWLVWQHKQITFEATSAVNIFGGTGNIAVTFKALILTPDSVTSGSFRLMPGTTITASGTSDSASGTEMACTMTWIP